MNDADKANLTDSLNLLLDLVIHLKYNNIEHANRRVKEFGYIAYPERIMKLLEFVAKQ